MDKLDKIERLMALAKSMKVSYFRTPDLEVRFDTEAKEEEPQKRPGKTEISEDMPPDDELLFASVDPIEFVEPMRPKGDSDDAGD